MVNTSDKAELQNCITNTREIIKQIKNRAERLGDTTDRDELRKLTGRAEILLREADERCSQLF